MAGSRPSDIATPQRAPLAWRSATRRMAMDGMFDAGLAKEFWHNAERWITEGEVLQQKDRCSVVRYAADGEPLLVKLHTWGNLVRTLRMAMRTTAASKCYRLGAWLAAEGIPTPRPLACLERSIGPLGFRSYLVTEYFEGRSLYHLLRNEQPTTSELQDLASQVASIWQQLIDLGASHNDLKPENFIVDFDGTVRLIDLEKMRVRHRGNKFARCQLEDAWAFLHIRNWQTDPEAAEVFRQALLKTDLATMLKHSPSKAHPLGRCGYTDHELASGLTVAIVAGDPIAEQAAIAQSRESVEEFAAEVVVVRDETAAGKLQPFRQRPIQNNWVLVLRAGEVATPEVFRRLPEQIADAEECHAVSLRLERAIVGCKLPGIDDDGPEYAIRAFRRDQCSYSLAGGELTVEVDPRHVVERDEAICDVIANSASEYESYLHRQNAMATIEAGASRLQRAAHQAAVFASKYFLHGLYQQGRAGYHLARLEARVATQPRPTLAIHSADDETTPLRRAA